MNRPRIPDAKALLHLAAGANATVVLGFGFFVYFIYHAIQFKLARVWPPALFGDAAIFFTAPRQIVDLGDYPARLEIWTLGNVFPYPPSAVLLFDWLGAGGPSLYAAAWLIAMGGGLLVSLRGSVAAEQGGLRAGWLLIGALALVIADGPISWDLRNWNSNLVYLGLVLGGYALTKRRPAAGGVLIGLSVALKLYSGLLLLWLLLNRSWRAALAGAATLTVLAFGAPLLMFGVAGSVRLYLGWAEQLRIIADPQVHAALATTAGGPPLVSLERAAMTLTGEGPLAITTRTSVAALLTLWIAAVLFYVRRAMKSLPVALPSRAALADWTVLLLAPLPFSPWLEPYHAVPLLPAATLLVLVALDERAARRDRQIATAALLAHVAILLLNNAAGLPFRVRGLVLLGHFLIATLALGLLRPRLPATSATVPRGPGAASP